jgi:hypothetical protein
MPTGILWLGILLLPIDAPRSPQGRRIDLDAATLFIPDGYRPKDQTVDLILHLHGSPSIIEPAITESKMKAVLIEFNRKGLSSVYKEPFSDPKLFGRLVTKALEAVKKENLADSPRAGHILVSSFSAGFGGVRELLKDPETFARIDTLVMADSLYAGYEGDGATHRPDPKLMAGFVRFALEAAVGRKTFVLTHSAQVPSGYASTTETADSLIKAVSGTADPTRIEWEPGWIQTRQYGKGRLLILGFEGAGSEDHMRHLRGIARIWKAIPQ